MRLVLISDTHGYHNKLVLPEGDMLIHAGDVSSRGHLTEVKSFLEWYSNLDFKYKIFIAGNHDFFFERAEQEEIQSVIPENVIYLNDSFTEIEGIKIWGSPISPWFFDWAFNRHRGAAIKKHWDLIPEDSDIVVTHGPVYNILDKTIRGEPVGCKDLLKAIRKVQPRLHLCGHIHEAYGSELKYETHFINASVLDVGYNMKHPPVVVDW